jgi:hypothetical protein
MAKSARKVKNQNAHTVEVMTKLFGKASPAEIIAILAEDMGINMSYARVYYKWAVKNGKAPGEELGRTSKPKAESKPKLVKARTDRSALKIATPVTDKTVEELNDIKAKNLARLKAIGAKYQPVKKVVNGATTASDEEQLPSFVNPAFLTADEVKSLI